MAPLLIRRNTPLPSGVSIKNCVLAITPPVASGYFSNTASGNPSFGTSQISKGRPMEPRAEYLWWLSRTLIAPFRSSRVLANDPGWVMSPPRSRTPKTEIRCSTIPSASSPTTLANAGIVLYSLGSWSVLFILALLELSRSVRDISGNSLQVLNRNTWK